MVRRKGCISQWPYLVLGAMLGALLMYRRDLASRDRAFSASAGWTGIDERERLIVRLADVDHEQALVHVDLRCREPDTGRCVHGLEHVVDQLAHAGIDFRDRLSLRAQARIRKFKNGK